MHVALKLYRAILREHRKKLPPQMRALGDKYVAEEFRLHRNAKDEFLPQFYHAWQSYLMNLHGPIETSTPPGITNSLSSTINSINNEANSTMKFGQDLSNEIYSVLTDEQKEQLNKLQKEATKLSKNNH